MRMKLTHLVVKPFAFAKTAPPAVRSLSGRWTAFVMPSYFVEKKK
jgi:hypothetical protein